MASKGISKSSSSSSSLKSKYEVFLSFRGKDTRKNFIDHLYSALISAGVNTFRDDDQLPRGKNIPSELFTAIQDSKVSIVVFSEGYAYSRWCLNELVKIIECKNTTGQIVIPIFYDVDSSDVRKQSGSYAKAFIEHQRCFEGDMEMIQGWRSALSEAADLSGWDLQNIANGHESRFIQKIVEDILRKVNRFYLHVAVHPISIESRMEKVMQMLSIGSDEVRIVGISGMGGIGKTTIAKAVYNTICDRFEGSSFLSDVKDSSKQPNGLASLQQQLLCDILDWKRTRINNVDRGINLILERLCCRRVFIVLDDVDDSTQLKSLVGDRKWFGAGSRIIITTRDERLLTELEVDERYKVEPLNPKESIQLFSWHAFRRPYPKDDYFQVSKNLVDHVQGLPLALVVLGSHLFNRSKLEWESVVKKLQQVPHDHIQKKLRISFDTLDEYEQAIFLDIACFFNGMDKEYVMKILDGCGLFPVIGVSVLLERFLITIDQHGKVKMHDLLQDMGRMIVREESPNHIGKRSRLWFHQDVIDVLRKNKGSEVVEGLSLDVSGREDTTVNNTEAFAKMINLKLLRINSLGFGSGGYEKFSKELRWLCWHQCPLRALPVDLHLDNLVVLDMRFSNLKKLWKERKILHKLKILDLSYSIYLVETPNFAGLSSLEKLEFKGCTSLCKVHQSIGQLQRLEFLNLAECNNLRELPDCICNITSLTTLKLNGCSKLSRLPEHLGKLEALNTLVADGCALTQLPNSIGLLKNLKRLSLAGCKDELLSKSLFSFFLLCISPKKAVSSSLLLPRSFTHLSSLQTLDLSHQNLSDNDISIDFGCFQFLRWLNLDGNKLCRLPIGIKTHPRLEAILLSDCTNLGSISDQLPLQLSNSQARRGILIYRKNPITKIRVSPMTDYPKLVDMSDLHHLSNQQSWFAWESNGNEAKYWEGLISSGKVPDWFDYKETGTSLLFRAPSLSLSNGEIQAMIVCIVYSMKEEYNSSTYDSITINFTNKNKGNETYDGPILLLVAKPIDGEDHIWICYFTRRIFEALEVEEGDEMKVSVETFGRIVVNKCAIHLTTDYFLGPSS